jgi:DNA mismatch repair endonuclease MutH
LALRSGPERVYDAPSRYTRKIQLRDETVVLAKTPTLIRACDIIAKQRGRTLKQACASLGIPWNPDFRNKGTSGLIGELILGLENNGICGPDIRDISVEVKYLPVYMDKRIPKEPTQITMINFEALILEDWRSATMRKKIEKVFWVGYEVSRSRIAWDQSDYRLLGCHLEIMPPEDLAVCERDWKEIRTLTARGDADSLSCSMGRFIEPKTKGKNNQDVRRAPGKNGMTMMARRRAFYFKKEYTKTRVIPAILGRQY